MASFAFAVALFVGLQSPATPNQSIKIGQAAPDFVLPDDQGRPCRLADSRGRTVVLTFYPQDFTLGCQAQLRSLRDEMESLRNRSVRVYGISVDTVDSHRRFSAEEKLTFPLLSDDARKMLPLYDALASNGRAKRKTVIVGPDGKIVGIDDDVQSQFYKSVQSLKSSHGANLRLFLSDWRAEVGMQVPNFWLADKNGSTVSPFKPGRKGTVIVYLPEEPSAKAVAEKVSLLMKLPANAGVSFFGISRKGLSALPFPVGIDATGDVLAHLSPARGAQVWVANQLGVVTYAGPIAAAAQGEVSGNEFLARALDQLGP